MAGEGGGAETQLHHHQSERKLGHEDGGLRHRRRIEGLPEARVRLLLRGGVELRPQVVAHQRLERRTHPVNVRAVAGLADVQAFAHPGALRALPREQEERAPLSATATHRRAARRPGLASLRRRRRRRRLLRLCAARRRA
jgi:hypothetical protein